MTPDGTQSCWELQDWRINPDDAAHSMRQLDWSFNSIITKRDRGEIGTSLVMIPITIVGGIVLSMPWPWYLTIPANLWVAGFMLVDRLWQRRAAPAIDASLRAGIEYSLSQVEHQIWLLRNILWWYILPPAVPAMFFIVYFCVQIGQQSETPLWFTAFAITLLFTILVAVLGVVYWANQHAVRTKLEPLREHLQAALSGLDDESPHAAQ